jgi:hypothetical protein
VRVLRLGLVAAVTAALLAAPSAGVAWASEPQRAGWWNSLSGGGFAAPQPTTAEGDLRVAQGLAGPLAYAALLYVAPGSTSADLTLKLRDGRTAGTPAIMACPTADTEWEAGGNQPAETGPAYDCALSTTGVLSEDGTSITFALDDRLQLERGTWSFALAPVDGSSPFSVDLEAPAAGTFVASQPPAQPPASDPPPDGSDGTAWDAPTGDSRFSEPSPFVPAEPPPVDEPVVEPPAAADAETGGLPTLPPPAVPVEGEARSEQNPRGRLLALLTLLGGTVMVGYSTSNERSGPRLIGGRARALGVVDEITLPSAEERPRGIGRFARERHAPPRRLR